MPDTHLMIVHPQHASLIMTGQKLVEARFSVDRRAPFNRVQPGDEVFIKSTGQATIGKAAVVRVDQFDGLVPNDIDRLQTIYNDRVMGDDGFWDTKRNATDAVFITLGKVRLIHDDSIVPEELRTSGHSAWRVLGDDRQHAHAA